MKYFLNQSTFKLSILGYNIVDFIRGIYGDKWLFRIDGVDPGAVPGTSTNKNIGGDIESTHIIKK